MNINFKETVLASVILLTSNAHAVSVNLELSLLVDISTSINSSEYDLQRSGYAAGFRDLDIQSAIINNPNGIAVNMIMWSSLDSQAEVVPWTHLTDAASSNAFADLIDGVDRPFNGSTGLQAAIAYAVDPSGGALFDNSFDSVFQIIDVSGDGRNGIGGLNNTTGRDAAIAAGVDVINGLVISTNSLVLDNYINNVQFGTDSFVNQTDTFETFGLAIKEKLNAEITSPVPVPAAVWLFCTSLLGLVGIGRYKTIS